MSLDTTRIRRPGVPDFEKAGVPDALIEKLTHWKAGGPNYRDAECAQILHAAGYDLDYSGYKRWQLLDDKELAAALASLDLASGARMSPSGGPAVVTRSATASPATTSTWLDNLDAELAIAKNVSIRPGDRSPYVIEPSHYVRESIERDLPLVPRGIEVGGCLISPHVPAGGYYQDADGTIPVGVSNAIVAATDCTADSMKIDRQAALDYLETHYPNSHLIGTWHVHPNDVGSPSRADAEASASSAVIHDREVWLDLIVTASADTGSWAYPSLHGWVTRREGNMWVCEPATVWGE